MKKRGILFLGILLSLFVITSIKAAGSAPSVYNSDAKSLLEMLWAKLDEAIVANYNAGMLVRYHDHEGTNPGDFVSRGLPIGTNGIENSAVTAAKMSTVAKTHMVSVYLGDLPAVGGAVTVFQAPIFVAPSNGTITYVSFTNSDPIATNPTNYSNLILSKRIGTGIDNYDNCGYISTMSVPFEGYYDANRIAITYQNSFSTGDRYTFRKYDGGAGIALNNFLVTLEYTVSE